MAAAVAALPGAPRSPLRGATGPGLALILALAAAPAALAGAPGDPDAGLPLAPLTEVPGIVVVPSLPEADLIATAPLDGEHRIIPPNPRAGELTLQWRSERYLPGPQGLEVDGNASGVEIGVGYKLRSAIRVGALAQFDPAAEVLYAGQRSLSERGWMAGPVTAIEIARGLTLEARAAWGVAEGGADDLSGGTGAQRRLLSARLAQPYAYGAWRFTPSVNVSHLWEGLGGPAGQAHVTEAGRINLAPELAYRLDLQRATFIEPKAVLGGFWTFDDLSKATAPGLNLHAEPRLKAEAGVTFGVVDGAKLQALGAVEGGEAGTPDVWTGRLQLSVPLR